MADSKRKKTSGYFVTVGTGEKIQYNSNPTRSKPKVTETQKQAAEARVQQYRSAAKENASTQSGLAKPAKITSSVSGDAWTRATPSQTAIPKDRQKSYTESRLKTYQTQMDRATSDAYDWKIREDMENIGGMVPKDVLDRTNKSIYTSSAQANSAAQAFGQRKNELLKQNYETRSQDMLNTVNADKAASSALKTAQGLESLQRQIRDVLEQSSAEGIDRSSAKTRRLGLQYGLTEAECKNIWSMQAAITRKLNQAKATVEKTGVSYDDAYEYLRRQELSQEAANKKTALEKELDDNGLEMAKHTGLSVLAKMGKGVDYVAGIAGNWGHNDERNLDTYRPMNSDAMSATNYVNTVRGKVGSEIQEDATAGLKNIGMSDRAAQFGGEASKFLYDTGMSIADNAAMMAVAGVAGAGTAGTSAIVSGLMGTGAAADQMKNILDNGGTNDQAMVGGFAAGVAEALFEKVSVDALLKPKNITSFKSWAKEALKQGGVEASEEVCTELANMFTDALIRGQDSDFQRAIAFYQTEEGGGLSLAEAKKKAYLDAIGQVALAGLGGFISGGIMQGVKGGVGLRNYNSAMKNVGQAVKTSSDISDQITKGLTADKDSEAYKLATEVKAQYESGKTVDQNTLGKLTVENIKNASDAIEAAKQNQTETAARVVAEAQREMQTTGQVSGETLAKLKTVAVASQDTSPAADISAKELATQAQITQAENPGVDVLDAAATLFLENGITKKPVKAKEKAKIVQALIDGKKVENTDINKLNPDNPKARALFTQLTGVQFPDGKMSPKQLYDLYRSAHDVAVQAQTESVAIDSAEGRETFPGVNRILDETATVPETSAAQPTLNQETETARATAQRYFDEAGLPDFQTFSEWFLQEVDPNADEGKIASAYGQLLKDVGSVVSKDGQRMNRQQFEEFVKGGKDGDQLTDTDIDELWFSRVLGEIDQQKRVNESALKARKETLNRVSDSINRALKPYGLSCTVDYDMDSNVNGDVGEDGVIHLNGNVVTTESAMIYVLGHEVVHKAPAEFVKSIEDAFNKLNKDGLIKDAELKYRIEHKTEVIEFLNLTYLNHLTKLAQQEAAKNGETTFDAETYQEKLKSEGVDGQTWAAYVEEEYAADLMRSVFLSDPDILGKLAAENPSAVEESLTWTQKMLRGFTKKGQQEKEIKKILSGLEANLIQGLREGRPADHEDMRPSQDRHSVSTMLEAINLDIESKDGSGRLIVRDINGNEVTEVTEKMIRQSRLGAVLRESVTRGRISAEKMDKQITFFKDFTNQLLKTQDLDMLFAVSGSLGFQEVPRGTKLDSDVGKDTKFAGFTNNSDPQYKRTVDFTTICLKTQAVIDAMSETMMKLDHGLTESEIVDIVYKNTHDAGEPVPCPVCYVFSRWVGLGGLFDNMSNWQEMYKNSSKEDLQKVIDGLQSKIERIVGESVKVKEDGTTETVSEGKARTKLKNELTKQSRGIKAGAIQSELDAITAEAKALPTKAAIKKEGKAQGWTAEDVDKRTSEILDQKAKLQQKKNKLREQMKAKNLDAMKAEDLNLSAEEQAQLDSLNADLMILDQWSWLTQVRMKDGYEPVPHDILFDINKGNEFATNYPDAWKFRTTRGPAMGKAAAPYSPMHLGQIITGAGMSDISKLGVQANNKVLDSENGELTKDALKSLDASQNAMRAQNLLNGLRFQSTSDFRFEYALDYLLAFMDLQAIGGKVQLYTKVPEAVGFLASMGAEVNCSLMPLGLGYDPVTKELKFSSVTGMNADDAFNLARSYDNVQTIMVGTSDEHIRLCMADDRIQFIIPYHASGSSEARYQSMMQTVQEQVGFRDDYSEYQTDKLIETEDQDILNARSARKKILTAQAATLTESELATIRKLKDSGNDILWELYKRFNGRNIDGVPEPLNQKYLEPSQRSNDPVYYDENCLHLNLNENGEVVSTEPVKLGSDVADMIFPFEYWDKTTTLETADQNGEAFKEYCKLLGIRPRFSGWSKGAYKAEKDFSNESGYWKTLIDRRMYNRDGSYHEQKTIDVTNLDQRFFSRKDSVKGIVQPSQLNDKSKTAEIAEKSAREIAALRGEAYTPAAIKSLMTEDSVKGKTDAEISDMVEKSDIGKKFSLLNADEIPKKVVIAYKAFYAHNGQLYPPMVANLTDADKKKAVSNAVSGTLKSNDTPVGLFLGADIGQIGRYKSDATQFDVAFQSFWSGKSKAVQDLKAELKKTGLNPNGAEYKQMARELAVKYKPELASYSKTELHHKKGDVVRNESKRLAVENDKGSGTLAFRPGWHLGLWPDAKQFNKNSAKYGPKSVMPDGLVFAKCIVAADVDYQLDAMELGMTEKGSFDRTQAGLPRIPVGGYYKYRTNADPTTAPWLITGSMAVLEIMDDDMTEAICQQYGVTRSPRESDQKIDLAKYGLKAGAVNDWAASVLDAIRDYKPGETIDFEGLGLKAPAPTADQIAQYSKSQAQIDNETLLQQLLDEVPEAYVPRKLNFDDEEIQKEFARNKQDVEYYREQYLNRGEKRYSITGENDAVENEKAIRKLENEIEDINSKLDLASVDGLSEIEVRRLRNQLTKNQYELDQRNAAERKAAVRTPLQTVLYNLDNYRAIDLESIANQLTDNAWDDVETLSAEELKSGIREIIQDRAGDMSPLEMQSPKFGVYVRKPSTSAGVRYSVINSDYMAAVERGDMETAQKMVDEAAKKAGYNSPVLYHGSPSFGFTQIYTKKSNDHISFFATDSMQTAGTYSGTSTVRNIGDTSESSLGMYQFYANTDGMVEFDAKGAESNHIALGQAEKDYNDFVYGSSWYSFATAKQLAKYAKQKGYTGVIIKNVVDAANPQSRKTLSPANVYIFFSPQSQLKSADPVTYDDNGNVIPLSERFQTTSPDIRYSITPEFEQWYRSMFDNPADADASLGKATRYNELMQKYGEMDEANNAVRETPVPVKSTKKKAVSETVRTVMGAEATPNSRIPTIVEAVADGKLAHVPTANNVYSRRAAGTLRREGWAKTLRDWTAEVRSGKSSPDLVAMGAVLLNNAGNSNATGTEYLDILADYVELMSRNGKSLQMGNLFKTLSPEGRLYMAEKIAKNINEKIRERKGKKTKAAEDAALDDIIEVRDTALQTIKDIFDALSEDRNKTSHGVPVEDWMKEVGNRLAGQISSNLADKVQRQRPITKVIQEDLLKFAESYALPKGKNLGVERRASDRVADFFNNRKAYAEAWNQAQSELRNRYKDDPEKLDALEEFLNGTLGYNGTGSDAVMMRAVAEFALDGDTKARDIVMRAKMGDRKALEARVFNALNSKVQATGSDADILRDAVSRFVSNTLADSGIDSEKALANRVKSAMKDIGVKMSDIIRQGAESKEAVANRIADMLVKEYKVSQEGADEAARIVVDKFTEMTAEAAQTKLESMFKARPTRAERSLLLRFDELVNLGAFTSNQFNHLATQKIFGVDVQIDPALIDEYRAAKTDKARDEVLDKITTNIAEQIPATKMEQFTALRYLNMLGNLKTQARNVVGNLAYQPVRMMKDQVGAAIETVAQNIFGMDIERTKAFGRDMETYKFGLKDFEEVRQIIMGGGKYNDNARFSQDIESKRRIFKSALLEKYRVLTNEAMDIGDAVFSKLAYADALSGYMKANGTTWSKASEELRDKARVYAIQQAAEATYRDNNAFSDAISRMRIPNADTWATQAINTIGEGVMPFRKTPANILVRTVEYSPVGLALSAINAGRAKAGADVTATQVIDQLAKGLTGSALMVLGYALANRGLLRGGDDDEEKKAEFDDLLGHQAYAIELGGYSITLDWLAPEAVPLFLGAQVSKAMEDGAMSPGDVMRTLASIPDPILEMSMLQGLNDAIKNASSYGDDQALVRFTGNALWSYLTQGMTSTLMGQAVRAVNNTRMTTYVDKNSDMPSGMQSAIGKLTAKLPLPKALKYNQIPYIDAWGRMEQNADNAALNFVFQFANPAYVSKVEVSDTESELERLYGATKKTSVLPQRAPKKFSHDGQVINLTADQYVVFASDVGRTSYNTVTDLTGSKLYQNLSDADKARAVENVYDYAKQTAKESLVGYKVDSWVKEAGASGNPALYCAIKAATYNVEGIPDPKDPEKTISNSKGLQIMETIYKMPGLTEKQKQTYIELFAGKSIQGYSESKVKRELEKMRRKAAK